MEKECTETGISTGECEHCLRKESDDFFSGLQVFRVIDAKFSGRCVMNTDHRTGRHQKVGLVGLKGTSANRALGWACTDCLTRIQSDLFAEPRGAGS